MSKPGASGSSLDELAETLIRKGPHKVERTPKRIRVLHNRAVIVDTTSASMVWEHPHYPQYYVPLEDVKICSLKELRLVGELAAIAELTVLGDGKGRPTVQTDRVIQFRSDDRLGPLAGLVRLEFASMDRWLEEDVPVFVHPKDPYKRIDILSSSRPVEVRVGGQTVARAPTSLHLYETGLPARYYLPPGSAEQEVLRKSALVTQCPYKGDANYYDVVLGDGEGGDGPRVFRDVAWYYESPTHESEAVAGHVCFYNEKVDILLDGKVLERPKTPFS